MKDVGLLRATDLLRSSLQHPDSRVYFQCPALICILSRGRSVARVLLPSSESSSCPEIQDTATLTATAAPLLNQATSLNCSSLVVLHWRSRIQSHSLGSHIGKYLWKHFVKGRDVCLHAGDHVLKGVHVLLFHSLLQFLMSDAIPSARCGRCVFVPCNRVFTSPSFRNMYHESCNMECKIHEELVTVRYVGEISALFLHRRCWFHLAVQRPWTAPSHVTAIGTGRETERLFGRSPTLHPVPKKCAPSASIPTRSSHFPSASFKQESMILSSSSLWHKAWSTGFSFCSRRLDSEWCPSLLGFKAC